MSNQKYVLRTRAVRRYCDAHSKDELAAMVVDLTARYDHALDVLIRYVRSVVAEQEKRKRPGPKAGGVR